MSDKQAGGEEADLGAFTSAPRSNKKFTTRTLPPAQAAWSGSTPSRTEFTGWPCESAYWTRPMSPEAEAECKPRWGTAGVVRMVRGGEQVLRAFSRYVELCFETVIARRLWHS